MSREALLLAIVAALGLVLAIALIVRDRKRRARDQRIHRRLGL